MYSQKYNVSTGLQIRKESLEIGKFGCQVAPPPRLEYRDKRQISGIEPCYYNFKPVLI